jgi:GH15 family glucan-1,4-alpha-glucosidase
MSYQPIENYGIIGNMRTVALVGMNGSIDWYCYPHFDSPSLFGAILDDKKGGRFQISAGPDGVRHKQSLAYPERLDQARLLFERVLGYANRLGLYAEQTGPQGEALGNFPQPFTHLALISAAFNLDRMLGSQV